MSDLPAFLAPILEDLSSLRSSTARRLRALRSVDGLLATLCLPQADEDEKEESERERIGKVFVGLQDSVAWNVVSRVTPLAARLLPVLHGQLLNQAPTEDIKSSLDELSACFLVIQGMSLLHGGSKDLIGGTRSSIEMILDLLLLTRHLPSLQSETTSPSKSDAKLWPQSPLLAADLLDTLFVVLVDSPKNLKTFEDTGGLEIVRKVLKSKNVGKQVRMKCLEFLIFYLLPEGSDDPTASIASLLPRASPNPNASLVLPVRKVSSPPRPSSPPRESPSRLRQSQAYVSSPTPRSTPSRSSHRRSDSASSVQSVSRQTLEVESKRTSLQSFPRSSSSASSHPSEEARPVRSRQTTFETDPALAALISRVRATPSRSSSTSVPRPRPPPNPFGLSHSTADITTRRYDRPASAAAHFAPPSTPSSRDRFGDIGARVSPAVDRSAPHTPTRQIGLSSHSRRTASDSPPVSAAATPVTKGRRAVIEAFLQTPQKEAGTSTSAGGARINAPRDVFGGPVVDARTPSRYRLDDDDLARSALCVSSSRTGANGIRPTPRKSSHTRPALQHPSPTADIVDPRANGPMLPPPLPAHRRSSSSTPAMRKSRTSALIRKHHSSTPVESTLDQPSTNGRTTYFDSIPLPKRDVTTPSPHPSPAGSNASLPESTLSQFPSPLLPLSSSKSPNPSISSTRPSSASPSTPTSPSAFAQRPTVLPSPRQPAQLRNNSDLLGDVQAFVLSPSVRGEERLRGLWEERKGVGLGFRL